MVKKLIIARMSSNKFKKDQKAQLNAAKEIPGFISGYHVTEDSEWGYIGEKIHYVQCTFDGEITTVRALKKILFVHDVKTVMGVHA